MCSSPPWTAPNNFVTSAPATSACGSGQSGDLDKRLVQCPLNTCSQSHITTAYFTTRTMYVCTPHLTRSQTQKPRTCYFFPLVFFLPPKQPQHAVSALSPPPPGGELIGVETPGDFAGCEAGVATAPPAPPALSSLMAEPALALAPLSTRRSGDGTCVTCVVDYVRQGAQTVCRLAAHTPRLIMLVLTQGGTRRGKGSTRVNREGRADLNKPWSSRKHHRRQTAPD